MKVQIDRETAKDLLTLLRGSPEGPDRWEALKCVVMRELRAAFDAPQPKHSELAMTCVECGELCEPGEPHECWTTKAIDQDNSRCAIPPPAQTDPREAFEAWRSATLGDNHCADEILLAAFEAGFAAGRGR